MAGHGREEGRVRDGAVSGAGGKSWKGADMVRVAQHQLYTSFLFLCVIDIRLKKISQSHLLVRVVAFPLMIWEKRTIIGNKNKS